MAQYTITYSETTKGWTSFWGYFPDWFARLGNRFYTFKNGQLWEHHDKANPLRNNFYNSQGYSSIKTVFNDAMADDKAFRNLVLEANEKWAVQITTNYTDGSLAATDFHTRESKQWSFLRGNEDADNVNGNGQGIGVIQSVSGLNITFNRVSEFVNIGDKMYQLNSDTQEFIGTITAITGTVITVDAITITPVVGRYSYAKKNARAEGGDLRGYYMEVLLSSPSTAESELFAVGSEASKSYV